MKFLVIDTGNGGLDIAYRAKMAGHQVRLFVRNNKDGSRPEVGDGGMVDRVPHWEPSMGWADLIFCTDNNFYTAMLEHYRDKGYPIFGPSLSATQWEQKRDLGEEVLKRVGIKTIPSKTFTKYDEAIKYVIETNKPYVCKPIGDGDKALSYVPKSPAAS